MLKRQAPSQLFKKKSKYVYSDDEDDEIDIKDEKEPGVNRLRHILEDLTKVLLDKSADHNAYIEKLNNRPYVNPDTSYDGHSETFLQMRYKNREPAPLHNPNEPNALVLYTPPEDVKENEVLVHVVVDPVLGRVLRPHQREGVQFMYDCLTGVKIPDYFGCILADDMGLGKTLQCITLLWTLLRQSPDFKAGPTISNVVIICPSSLVKNWFNEINKWLGTRLNALAIDSGQAAEAVDMKLANFGRQQVGGRRRVTNPVLVVSYETFRGHAHILENTEVGLMICDEGHRLKNMDSQTYVCLKKVNCKRRIIISGTPIQNDLLEYYSLVDFVNPGLLGNPSEFRKTYENPISKGRDADASDYQVQLGQERQKMMIANVDRCLIRRTAELLSKYLPPKYEMIVCVNMEPAQKAIYEFFIKSKRIQKTLQEGESGGRKTGGQSSLQAITMLKKLCNHPQLIYDLCKTEEGLEEMANMFPPGFSRSIRNFEPLWSGKMKLLDLILANIRNTTDDRIVLISNYTQTIDLFQRLCDMRNYKTVRLDGTMTTKKRDKIVQQFNDPTTNEFVFLLSSKAGGCGLNLIGANRLIMFDPDWNPANDGQAMARVWRDGQRKTCYLYRFLATGTIEEKIFQRQSHKKALSNCIVDSAEDVERHFSLADLKELFRLEDESILSDTHSKLSCKRCVDGKQVQPPPETADTASDLADWHHCYNPADVPDDKLAASWAQCGISFAFYAMQDKPKDDAPPKSKKNQSTQDSTSTKKEEEEERATSQESVYTEKTPVKEFEQQSIESDSDSDIVIIEEEINKVKQPPISRKERIRLQFSDSDSDYDDQTEIETDSD